MREQFDWDPAKNTANLRKYGVSFREATEFFSDPSVLIEYDAEHSLDDDRYIVIGYSQRTRLLYVVNADREHVIRIISARRATSAERERYETQPR